MSIVNVIPATKGLVNGGKLRDKKELRVAAYCRVSTGDESQQTSYTTQKAFYSSYINSKKGWKMAGIYADTAISGTSRARRKEFNRMIDDAMSGKIDYIVTKSISRFARNTVDTLNCVRQLRQQSPPIGIYFEKENIDTLDASSELLLTILSALAQEESRSISENIRWTFQKKFQSGKPQINLNRMLGYDKGEDGEWVINSEQAEVIRFIFRKYVSGHSANSIAHQANDIGMRTVNGKLWTAGAVLDTLRNEKYVGDLEMQKTVTKDFLTHRSIKNIDEAPKYYVKDHHAAIIDRFTWDKVQMSLGERGATNKKTKEKFKGGQRKSPFYNLTCGEIIDGKECGECFLRMTYSGTAKGYRDERSEGFDPETQLEKYMYAYPVWRCKRKVKKMIPECSSMVIQECALEQSFMELLYRLKWDYEARGKDSWIENEFQSVYHRVFEQLKGNSYVLQRMEILDKRMKELESTLQKTVEQQAESITDVGNDEAAHTEDLHEKAIYLALADNLSLRIEEYRREREALEKDQEVIGGMKKNYDFFVECLKKMPALNSADMKTDIDSCARKRQKEAERTPDYLRFDRSIYCSFIQSGKVRGDEIEYLTNFGVKLISYGNSRTLKDFLGYKKYNEDGTVEFLNTCWKVNDRKIQYRRTERKNHNPMK